MSDNQNAKRKKTGQSGSRGMVKQSEDEEALDAVLPSMCAVTGTKQAEVANHIVAQVGYAFFEPKSCSREMKLVKAVHALEEMAPQNLTEAMLAGQMIKVNAASQQFLSLATAEGQPTPIVDLMVDRATRLMRLFTQQVDVMQRLQGKAGQQRVVVEHVNVHKGGQAIVGAVTTLRGPEGGKANDDQTTP